LRFSPGNEVTQQGKGANRKEAMKKKGSWSVMLTLTLILSGSLASGDLLLAQESVPTASESQAVKAKVGKQNIYRDSGKIIGGQRADGKDLYSIRFGKHGTFERLVISIHEWVMDEKGVSKGGPPAAIPCSYEVTYEEYPCRLVFDFEGVRWSSATFPKFPGSNYISGMHSIFAHSWGNDRFAVILKKPIKYEVFELHNPAKVVADIKGGEKSAHQFPPVYSLRTKSSDNSSDYDDLRDIQEKLSNLKYDDGGGDDWGTKKFIPKGKKIRIIQSQDNKLFIEEGYYTTNQEALKRQKYFAEEGITLFIEKRKIDEIPKVIKK
jgi:hypothetical protein